MKVFIVSKVYDNFGTHVAPIAAFSSREKAQTWADQAGLPIVDLEGATYDEWGYDPLDDAIGSWVIETFDLDPEHDSSCS